MGKSKRLIADLRAEVRRLERQNTVLAADKEVLRERWRWHDEDLRDTLLLLGKTTADLPEIREAARAVRYADEHEKNMAVAKDWTL